MIDLGRTYGFLQRWADAARVYARLFDQESLVSPGSTKFNSNTTVKAKPELLYAYLEWGVVEHELAKVDKQAERFSRASGIFDRLADKDNATPDSRLWWQNSYQRVRAMMDRGEYQSAATVLRDIKRNTSADYDQGKFGYQKRFADLETALSKKVF
jgi:hypothetical protein